MMKRLLILSGWLALAGSAGAQVWIEAGDAPSFPDSAAQVTRGQGALTSIVGTTDSAGGDLRDAYCVRIADPGSFLATTDPASDPGASGDFDTRLFLFRPDSAPVLANDDTPPSGAPFLSTLTGMATDGSNFVLSQPGEYVLIVGGSSDDPRDAADVDLFDIASDFDAVHTPNPAAGRFDHWEGGAPATGSYTMVLAGVEHCQGDLDAVFANRGTNRVCLGNDAGGSACRDASTDMNTTEGVALGFVDGDPHLDAVFGNAGVAETNRVCLGNGAGGFACSDVSTDLDNSRDVALGLVDGNQDLDAVFGNFLEPNRLCRGNGNGGFLPCSNISADMNRTEGVALGLVDGNSTLDAVFANFGQRNRVCLGDGNGGFACSDVSVDSNESTGVALGLVDGDPHLDAVFANNSGEDRVCLGDGLGAFTSCSDVSAFTFSTTAVALGFVDGDPHLDAVFARWNAGNRVCLGDGLGGFTSCLEISADTAFWRSVALGFVDGGPHLDAVFAANGASNLVCLGDGVGDFTCSDVSADTNSTIGVALGEVAFSQIFADGFESGDISAWSDSVP